MKAEKSSHAYGIGMIALIIGMTTVIIFYTSFYLPEQMATPTIADELLNVEIFNIEIVPGAHFDDGNDYSPKKSSITLGVNNYVLWTNNDSMAHTVNPLHKYYDRYSGIFKSPAVIKPGGTYSFLFTEAAEIEYYCIPHPWMSGTITIKENRF